MNKKAFTLMEILVVILILAVILSLYQVSHRNSQIIRTNERARAMFAELTNAARLFNEMYPNTKIYGGFGDNSGASQGYLNPCFLFEGAVSDPDVRDTMASYALRPRDWGITSVAECGSGFNYEGYKFVLCDPSFDSDATQPAAAATGNGTNLCKDSEDGGRPKFAVMINPDNLTYYKYANGYAWMTSGYEFDNTYQ